MSNQQDDSARRLAEIRLAHSKGYYDHGQATARLLLEMSERTAFLLAEIDRLTAERDAWVDSHDYIEANRDKLAEHCGIDLEAWVCDGPVGVPGIVQVTADRDRLAAKVARCEGVQKRMEHSGFEVARDYAKRLAEALADPQPENGGQ